MVSYGYKVNDEAQGRDKIIRWTRRHEYGQASMCPSGILTRGSGDACRDEPNHVAILANDAELDVCEIFSRPQSLSGGSDVGKES